MRVGFIGLGRMGAPMAARIATAGHGVVGYDISEARRQQGNPGTAFVDSPAAVASDADVVITSLPGPAEVQDVVYGADGLLSSMKPAAVLVETSTISPQQSRTLAKDSSARNVAYLDAPISGGAQGARDGTLVAMVGGATEVLDTVRPVLCCFAKEIFHLGPVGAGNVMKLVIQSIFLPRWRAFSRPFRWASAAALRSIRCCGSSRRRPRIIRRSVRDTRSFDREISIRCSRLHQR